MLFSNQFKLLSRVPARAHLCHHFTAVAQRCIYYIYGLLCLPNTKLMLTISELEKWGHRTWGRFLLPLATHVGVFFFFNLLHCCISFCVIISVVIIISPNSQNRFFPFVACLRSADGRISVRETEIDK